MTASWEHWADARLSFRWGLLLGAQGGVWILDDTWTKPLAKAWPLSGYLFTGVWNRGSLWITENDVAVVVAQAEEEHFALPGDFGTRPWATPLQERKHIGVLLAQRGLRSRELQLPILEFAGLALGGLRSRGSHARSAVAFPIIPPPPRPPHSLRSRGSHTRSAVAIPTIAP